MRLRLPDGALEQIRYTGDLPPKVTIDRESLPLAQGWPAGFDDPAPFAALDRVSLEMRRQIAETMREIDALTVQSAIDAGGMVENDISNLPAGSESYSFVSTGGGNVFCARSVEITSRGDAQKPRVVSRSYGNCGNAGAVAGSAAHRGAATASQDDARSIADVPPSSNAMLHAISDAQ